MTVPSAFPTDRAVWFERIAYSVVCWLSQQKQAIAHGHVPSRSIPILALFGISLSSACFEKGRYTDRIFTPFRDLR